MNRARLTAVIVAALGVLVAADVIDVSALIAGVAGLLAPSPLEK